LILAAALAAGVAYYVAGRAAPPSIEVHQPGAVMGQKTTVDVSVGAPKGRLTALAIGVEQNGKRWPLFDLASPDRSRRARNRRTGYA
jgi:hypothetical protein